jgi:hypothetical protein
MARATVSLSTWNLEPGFSLSEYHYSACTIPCMLLFRTPPCMMSGCYMLAEVHQVDIATADVSVTIINDTLLSCPCFEPLILTCVEGICR